MTCLLPCPTFYYFVVGMFDFALFILYDTPGQIGIFLQNHECFSSYRTCWSPNFGTIIEHFCSNVEGPFEDDPRATFHSSIVLASGAIYCLDWGATNVGMQTNPTAYNVVCYNGK